jgi:hypothetical protein
MKLSTLKTLSATLLLLCLIAPAAVVARDDDDHDRDHDHDGRQLFVDDNHAQCPNAQFVSIQAAVTAASPGDTINVCPGTYREQVVIKKSLTVRGISVANQNLALIQPLAVAPNSTSTFNSGPIAAIVVVDGAKNVNLTNLTVDGGANTTNACGPELVGVFYRNSSGRVDSLAIRNIRLGAGSGGCQSGIGIFVQSGQGRTSRVDLANNSIHDYQKNGIAANEVGTYVNVSGNAVTGLGSTNDIAQNGIQIGFGAAGVVDSNSVIDHIFGQCISLQVCSATATNILVFQSDGVKVTRNNTGNSQVNIDFQEANKGEVTGNTIFESRVFDGVALIGNSNRASGNIIFNSEESGVFVQGNKNEVTGNTINEAPVGVLEASGTGNKINDNRFFNTGLNVVRASSPGGGASVNSQSSVNSLSLAPQARSAQPARP